MPKYALYNGFKLPALPDYDADEYPYLYIVTSVFYDGTGYAYLYACSEWGFIETVDEYNNLTYSLGGAKLDADTEGKEFFRCYWMTAIGEDITTGMYAGVNTREWTLQGEHECVYGSHAGNSDTGVGIDWANHHICWEDGTLFILGTDPVPVYFDPKAWLVGFTIGLASKGSPWSKATQKEPVAYLYNGVRLPKLPEWDREAYPYAVITKIGDEPDTYSYRVIADAAPIVATATGYPSYKFKYGKWYEYDLSTGLAWIDRSTSHVTNYGRIVWANENVADKEGNVYMAKTEPVPVYTATPKTQLMSFNGVRLPALPYIDTEAYPYVIIGREISGDNYRLEAMGCKAYIRSSGLVNWSEVGDQLSTFAYMDGVGWSYLQKQSTELPMSFIAEVAWANFDVLNEDGSLYLAASEPVPVYE